MRRRGFLSLLGAAITAPALPVPVAAATPAIGYNRYMYGLAVFHTRTVAGLTAADLAARLRVNAGTAQAMIAEMRSAGILAPALQGTALRAVNPQAGTGRPGYVRRALRRIADTVAEHARTEDPNNAPDRGMETENG